MIRVNHETGEKMGTTFLFHEQPSFLENLELLLPICYSGPFSPKTGKQISHRKGSWTLCQHLRLGTIVSVCAKHLLRM